MNHIIVDLEMNTPVKDSGKKNELIEIGAVKLDDKFNELSQFQTYVKPQNGDITEIITKLTGITQDMVVDAPLYQEAIVEFAKWIEEGEYQIYSWSNCDKKQIEHENEDKCFEHSAVSRMLDRWVDLQQEYDTIIGTSHTVALDNALKSAGIKEKGKPHTALGDAINTAELFKVLKDEKLRKKRLGNLIELFEKKEISSTLLDLFPEMASYINVDEEQ